MIIEYFIAWVSTRFQNSRSCGLTRAIPAGRDVHGQHPHDLGVNSGGCLQVFGKDLHVVHAEGGAELDVLGNPLPEFIPLLV